MPIRSMLAKRQKQAEFEEGKEDSGRDEMG